MTKPRTVIGQKVFPETVQMLSAKAEVVAPSDAARLEPDVMEAALADADAWMAFMPDSVDEARLARYPRLRVIGGALKGGDNFDVDACTRRGVWFTLAPDLLTVPTAELAIALMIGLGRRVLEGDRWVRSGCYQGWEPRFYGVGLARSRIAFVGMGAIGQAIAARLAAFGAEQQFHDPAPPPFDVQASIAITPAGDLESLLAWADFVVLAAPLTPATKHIIDAAALERMRPGALLINPSRGSLVDEAAVLEALKAGRLGGYAADVFEMEDWARPDRPRTIAPELLARPDTLFTPHLGSAVVSVRQQIEQCAAQNILDALAGRTPRNAVNPQARSAVPA